MPEGEHREQLCELVARYCAGDIVGAEVGVHRGKTSAMLLKRFPRLVLYMVDRWKPAEEGSSYYASGDPCARKTEQECRQDFQATVNAVRGFDLRGFFTPCDSLIAAETMPPLDFAFIDADHSYEGVKRDLPAWWQTIKPGGFLSGHDYHEPAGRHTDGVKRAVDEWAASEGVTIQSGRGNVWWTCKSKS